jgi:hypothetical protein
MVLTSQPARPAGFFMTHITDCLFRLGVWNNLTFSSEDTGLVSEKKIIEALIQYGSREDPQYMIRIRGLFPDLAGEFLVTNRMAEYAFKGKSLVLKPMQNMAISFWSMSVVVLAVMIRPLLLRKSGAPHNGGHTPAVQN